MFPIAVGQRTTEHKEKQLFTDHNLGESGGSAWTFEKSPQELDLGFGDGLHLRLDG